MARLLELKSFLVRGQPFVDARSLQYLQSTSNPLRAAYLPTYRPWMIRLANCDNITPLSLARALYCLPHLVYLDLSGTTAAKDISIIREDRLSSLQVLKLRNIGLTDEGLSALAERLGAKARVWSLDVRNNALTDRGIAVLLECCFMPPNYSYSEDLPHYEKSARTSIRFSDARKDCEIIADQEAVISDQLTRFSVSCSLNHSQTGLSHLYISDNPITTTGVGMLLRTTQLVVLDVGKILVRKQKSLISHKDTFGSEEIHIITSSYELFARGRLKYLRINHTCVSGVEADRRLTTRSQDENIGASSQKQKYSGLVPSRLALRSLVLTGLPSSSVESKVPRALKGFLDECAKAEANWANHQLKMHPLKSWDRGNHSSLPDQSHSPGTSFMPKPFLGTLILEMSKGENVFKRCSSSTDLGDDVSANFTEALKGDFSFFEGENRKTTSKNTATAAANPCNNPSLQELDVVTAIAQFRKARYLEHKSATAAGQGGPGAGGHWSGHVKVVRPSPTG